MTLHIWPKLGFRQLGREEHSAGHYVNTDGEMPGARAVRPGPAAVNVSLRTASAHKYSVRAPQPIPGAFEAQAKHQDGQEHELLVTMDQAVAQYGLAKREPA